jgi:hypothetical protein
LEFSAKILAPQKMRGKIKRRAFLDVFGPSEFKSELSFTPKISIERRSNLMSLLVRNCTNSFNFVFARPSRQGLKRAHSGSQLGFLPAKDFFSPYSTQDYSTWFFATEQAIFGI